ncbi:MAG TPA: tetratricopeptide repeat protein, partial [Polyangiales bacterium]
PLLAELAQACLVGEVSHERYELHDLVRSYGLELAEAIDEPAQRALVVARTVAHYARVAMVAAVLVDPDRERITPMPTECPELSDHKEAAAWLSAEQQVCLRVMALSTREGLHDQTWKLAWALTNHLQRRGQWGDWATALQLGMQAAQQVDDPQARTFMHRFIGNANLRTGRLDEAKEHLERVIQLTRRQGNHSGEALAHRGLAVRALSLKETKLALTHNEAALELFRRAGNRAHEASTLNGIAWAHNLLGDPRKAIACATQALAMARELGSVHTQAVTLDTLGVAHRSLGELTQALACLDESLVLHEQTGDRYYTALSLDNIGDVWSGLGEQERAVSFWQRA